jgi:NAD(P)H dehydrogenase (quinone)
VNVNIAVVYYSATGNTHRLAEAVAEGAADAGADVRLRRVRELAPDEAIDSNPAWRRHITANRHVPEAELADLDWAHGLAFGSPTRYGMVAAQLKQFLDTTGPLWQQGKLTDKVVTSFTSAATAHGGHETTLLSLDAVFSHWGSVIVPLGYSSPEAFETGNPYGSTWVSGSHRHPDALTLRVARHQGGRLVQWALRAVYEPVTSGV